MPIVTDVEAVVVVDPVFASEEVELSKAGRVAEQEVYIGVLRERAIVEYGSSLSVCLQLLVFRIMQPTGAELELVLTSVPGQVVTSLIAFVRILPGEVA